MHNTSMFSKFICNVLCSFFIKCISVINDNLYNKNQEFDIIDKQPDMISRI